MGGAARAFNEWFAEEYEGYPRTVDPDVHFDVEELEHAYVAGWSDAMGARWETSSVPMLGIEGGEDLGPAHPGAPR